MVGPVLAGYARMTSSSWSFHRTTASSFLHGGSWSGSSGQPLTGKVAAGGGLVVVVGLAASAEGVVVAVEKVATTRPATTSMVVANLYFIHSSLSAVRQYSSWPRTPRSAEDLNARACTAALERHVTGCEGTALPAPFRPVQGRPTRSR